MRQACNLDRTLNELRILMPDLADSSAGLTRRQVGYVLLPLAFHKCASFCKWYLVYIRYLFHSLSRTELGGIVELSKD